MIVGLLVLFGFYLDQLPSVMFRADAFPLDD